jgi:iron(III) transport system substrate-binding protein
MKAGVYFLLLTFAFVGPVFSQTKPAWQTEWEKTLAAAKKEGRVTVYITAYGAIIDSGVFQKAYPEIKVVSVAAGFGEVIVQRILAERRAGKYLADVVIDGLSSALNVYHAQHMVEPIKPALMLPEITDESRWWQRKHPFADPEKQYVFRYSGVPMQGRLGYNTNLINPKEFKSHLDILNPKWKGKITARDIRSPGAGRGEMNFYYHNPEVGPEFIRRLFSEMEITLFRDFRQGHDWLATGRFPLCVFCQPNMINQAMSQGLPVDSFPLVRESAGIVGRAGNLVLMKNAPHPNAAKVFINWFLSREGQIAMQKALPQQTNSMRIDIPKGEDVVRPDDIREEGLRYLETEALDQRPVLRLFEEALAEGKRKAQVR